MLIKPTRLVGYFMVVKKSEKQHDLESKKGLDSSEESSLIEFSVFEEIEMLDDAPISGEKTGLHQIPSSKRNMSSTLSDDVVNLKVEAEVAKAKIELVSLYAQETKELEIQINTILKKINASNPNLKPLLIHIKKLLTNHSNLKRLTSASPEEKASKKGANVRSLKQAKAEKEKRAASSKKKAA